MMGDEEMKRPHKRHHRAGAVAVEFAIAAPVLFLFVFASVEFSRVNMIRNTIENAAYEGARSGVLPGATAAKCAAAAQDLLDTVGIADSAVTVTPPVILADTEEVTVAVEVPMTMANGYITPTYYLGRSLRTSVTLPRETGT